MRAKEPEIRLKAKYPIKRLKADSPEGTKSKNA